MRSERIFTTIHTTGRAVEQKNPRTVEQMEANSNEKCKNFHNNTHHRLEEERTQMSTSG